MARNFLNNRRVEVVDIEIQAMESLWLEFYTKILYPQQQREEKLHPKGCTMTNCTHPWDNRCKTKWQEMWQWEDYVLTHYKPPQVENRGVGAGIMAGVLISILALSACAPSQCIPTECRGNLVCIDKKCICYAHNQEKKPDYYPSMSVPNYERGH